MCVCLSFNVKVKHPGTCIFFQVNSLLALEQHPHHHPHLVMGFIYIYIHVIYFYFVKEMSSSNIYCGD